MVLLKTTVLDAAVARSAADSWLNASVRGGMQRRVGLDLTTMKRLHRLARLATALRSTLTTRALLRCCATLPLRSTQQTHDSRAVASAVQLHYQPHCRQSAVQSQVQLQHSRRLNMQHRLLRMLLATLLAPAVVHGQNSALWWPSSSASRPPQLLWAAAALAAAAVQEAQHWAPPSAASTADAPPYTCSSMCMVHVDMMQEHCARVT